jgi:peroxiredoxin
MENKTPSRMSRVALGLILALIAVNLLLINQNLGLRRQLAAAGRPAAPADALKAGETVGPVAGTDLNGRPFEVKYGTEGRRHLLLFFSPSCRYCGQQASLWREVLDKVDAERINVVGVVGRREDRQAVFDHAEGAGYFKTKTSLPVVFFDDASLASYKLTATPTTILIDAEGRVEHAWVGLWDEAKANEVAAALQ